MSLPHGKGNLWESILEVFAPATRTAAATSGEIDLRPYQGNVAVVVHSANGTGNADNTLTPTFTESDAPGGTFTAMSPQPTWYKGSDLTTVVATVPGVGGTNPGPIVAFLPARDKKPIKKLVMTPAGTTPSYISDADLHATTEYQVTGL